MPETVATSEELRRLEQRLEAMQQEHKRELAEQRERVEEFLASLDDQVSTEKALELTGIASRTTLIAERQRPGTLLRFINYGRSVRYSRLSCLNHKRAYQRRPHPTPPDGHLSPQ